MRVSSVISFESSAAGTFDKCGTEYNIWVLLL